MNKNVKTKKQVSDYYLRRIYRLLREDKKFKVGFRKLKVCGYCHFDGDNKPTLVEIDPRNEVISTLIHECLHWLYPNWSETKVVKTERFILNTLSERQVRNVIKALARII